MPHASDTLLGDLVSTREHLDDCVHCGLCLESCPTYLLWGQEADSPRGRITQIEDALNQGEISADMTGHIDSCLGCMACVSACPAGVSYDRLLLETRPAVERQHHRTRSERALRLLLFETLPYPDRLRSLVPALRAAKRRARAARALPRRVSLLAEIAPEPPTREQLELPIPEFTAALGTRRGQVGLLLGCVQRVFFSDVHRATIGMLTAEGYDVFAPRLPDCCGALELQAGEQEHGLARAQATIAAFSGLGELDAVIANAAGCGAAMKDYGVLLGTQAAWEFASRVRDITEFLAEIVPRAPRGPVPLRVVYHDACHLSHSQQITSQPRALLAAIPGLELLEVAAEPAICCGSAGLYNALQPEPAAALGRRKAGHLIASGAQVIAAANPGCAAQIGRHCRELGTPMAVQHPVELLWRSVQGA
jgi:glycolate oxidase iron-sulfur subunit